MEQEKIKELTERIFYKRYGFIHVKIKSKAERPRSTGRLISISKDSVKHVYYSEPTNLLYLSYETYISKNRKIITNIELNIRDYGVDWALDCDYDILIKPIYYCKVPENLPCSLFETYTDSFLDYYFSKHYMITVESDKDYKFLLKWATKKDVVLRIEFKHDTYSYERGLYSLI